MMLVVAFEGEVVVGDGPEPARLHVKIDQKITDVGRAQEIPVPKDAIEDVVRHKMPVDTRSILEEGGVVAPLPTDRAFKGSISLMNALSRRPAASQWDPA